MSAPMHPQTRKPTRALADAEEVLTRVFDLLARTPGGVIAFDLDSTLLDNRPRSARIFREYAAAAGLAALAQAAPHHFTDWNLEHAMRSCGADQATVASHHPPLRRFWLDRFFTSDYCLEDVSIPGAPRFVHALLTAGATVCYLTGRDETMRAGTLACFAREGFPIPERARVHLLMKPRPEDSDDEFKRIAHRQFDRLGPLLAAFDNEPTHANDYAAAFPNALVVHLATDHSDRPVAVRAEIPSILDFTAWERPPTKGAHRRSAR